jgi:small subunit ribosomal protein S5
MVKENNEKIPETPEVVEVKQLESVTNWIPKTQIGRDVFDGKIKTIDDVLKLGKPIREFEIIDKLVPNLKNELILVGGRTGKGGGIQRIPVRITAAMHKSGRRFTAGAFVVVGDENGLVGIGQGRAKEARDAINNATKKAKLNIIRVKRGCGSWECECGTEHSVPYKVIGKSGSVRVELMPAPKGVGLVADDETKKILKLAGFRDVWVNALGNTGMRINLISAVFDALKKLYVYEK